MPTVASSHRRQSATGPTFRRKLGSNHCRIVERFLLGDAMTFLHGGEWIPLGIVMTSHHVGIEMFPVGGMITHPEDRGLLLIVVMIHHAARMTTTVFVMICLAVGMVPPVLIAARRYKICNFLNCCLLFSDCSNFESCSALRGHARLGGYARTRR